MMFIELNSKQTGEFALVNIDEISVVEVFNLTKEVHAEWIRIHMKGGVSFDFANTYEHLTTMLVGMGGPRIHTSLGDMSDLIIQDEAKS